MNKPSIRICRIDMILIACTCIFCVIVKYFVNEIILLFLLSGRNWHIRCIWTCYWKHYLFCYFDHRLKKLCRNWEILWKWYYHIWKHYLSHNCGCRLEIVSTFTFLVEKFCEHVTWFWAGKTHPTTSHLQVGVMSTQENLTLY